MKRTGTASLDAVIPKTRKRLLATVFSQPEHWWSLSALARCMRTTPSSLQRELASLVSARILERRPDGNRVCFRARTNSRAHLELRRFFELILRSTVRQKTTRVSAQTAPVAGVPPILLSRYNREKLYNEVWSQPAMQVAKTYGISDVAIGKVCKKLLIPVPGRGYWAKRQAGKVVPQRLPLPEVTVMR